MRCQPRVVVTKPGLGLGRDQETRSLSQDVVNLREPKVGTAEGAMGATITGKEELTRRDIN